MPNATLQYDLGKQLSGHVLVLDLATKTVQTRSTSSSIFTLTIQAHVTQF